MEPRNESLLHVTGQAEFVDDLPLPPGTLHAVVFAARIAHGRLGGLDTSAALVIPDVRGVFTAGDVPGRNEIGVVIADEPLLVEAEIRYAGEPLAVVVADDIHAARRGVQALQAMIDPLPPLLDPREAQARGELFAPPRTFECGDVETAWGRCAYIHEGRVAVGGQEQLYLETQAALAIPREDGGMLVHSATQSPSATQAAVARVLGLQMHKVEVDVRRIGGGFGGKESQATRWAALAALAAYRLGRPVKLVLERHEDLVYTGKRHPYEADYKIGIDAEGRILAYQVELFQNAGAYTDLSLAILERTLFHAGGSYRIPNLRATAWSCRTHLAPNTAMRGFGGPQGMFVLETAIHRVAERSGIPAEQIQGLSLLNEGDALPYGQRVERCRARACWEEAQQGFSVAAWRREVEAFNATHPRLKKGLAAMPICFGISFTHLPLNQGNALIHIYGDGSIGLSTGAIEMGQGVNEKMRRVVATALGQPLDRVRVESTNTTRTANVSPSAASVTADLNGKALLLACEALRGRLLAVAAEIEGIAVVELELREGGIHHGDKVLPLDWPELIRQAYDRRVSLSAQAHYATPEIRFDHTTEHGHPFAYHVYGTAWTEATIDTLRGTYTIDRVRVVHDAGHSLDPVVDLGQVEGGIVQGIGWLTCEELRYSPDGRLLTDTLATYKVPDIHAAPEIETRFLGQAAEPNGLLEAKAVGEPPFMYGIGAWLALLQALRAARPEAGLDLDAPLTPERLLMALYPTP